MGFFVGLSLGFIIGAIVGIEDSKTSKQWPGVLGGGMVLVCAATLMWTLGVIAGPAFQAVRYAW